MLERLLAAETDSGQGSAVFEQTRKWGGRLILTAVMGYYVETSVRHFKHNSLFRRVDDAFHHREHHETPQDREQAEFIPAEFIEEDARV